VARLGPDSVGPDHQVGPGIQVGPGGPAGDPLAGDDAGTAPERLLAQGSHQIGPHQRDAEHRVFRPPAPRHVTEQLAATRPHELPRDREPGLLHLLQAAERRQRPQAVDGQAHIGPDRPGRVLVSLVHDDLGPDPGQRDRTRRSCHAATDHDCTHRNSPNEFSLNLISMNLSSV
jgi:hypothetical protein